MTRTITILMFTILFAANVTSAEEKSKKIPPLKKVEKGILFSFYAPKATKVHVAGNFNNWADNQNGRINSDKGLLTGPDENGTWTKIISLGPGEYKFQFVVNTNQWKSAPGIQGRDENKNAEFIVDNNGRLKFLPEGIKLGIEQLGKKVTFRVFAPNAKTVYLAGSFNNWANNDKGKIKDPNFAMKDDNNDGIWELTMDLPPGTHKYKYAIDGGSKWFADPKNKAKSKDDNSMITINQ